MRDSKAYEIALKRLHKAHEDGTDYLLITESDRPNHSGPVTQFTYVGTNIRLRMFADVFALKSWVNQDMEP